MGQVAIATCATIVNLALLRVTQMEKTIFPLLRLKFTVNSIKNVHVPIKPKHIITATRGWEYFAKDYL